VVFPLRVIRAISLFQGCPLLPDSDAVFTALDERIDLKKQKTAGPHNAQASQPLSNLD
jgi:hypothetical protein